MHLAGFYFAYFCAVGFAELLAIVPVTGISIWPPSGLLLATFLLSSRASWPWWIVAGSMAELTGNLLWFHNPLPVALLFCAGNALEAMLGAWLLDRYRGTPFRLDSLWNVLALVVLGAGIAPMVAASVGSAALAWSEQQPLTRAWPLLWIGDATGVLIVAPLVLVLVQNWQDMARLAARRGLEATLLAAVFIGVAVLSLGGYLPFAYIVMPPLLWAAVRFELPGAVVASVLLALMTALFTVTGISPFAISAQSQMKLHVMLQLLLVISALSALVVAVISRQHHQALLRLQRANDELEQRVAERTARLRDLTRRFELALANSPITVFEQDAQLRYQWIFNSKLERSDSSSIGKTDAEILDPAIADAVTAMKRRVLETGEARRDEVIEAAPGQQPEYFDLWVEPRRDEAGRVIGVIGVSTDITDRKHIEIALERSVRREALLSGAAARLLQTDDPQGVVEELCRAVMDFLDCDVFFNYLADTPTGALKLDAYAGISDAQARRIALLDHGEAICVRVAHERQPVVLEDVLNGADPRADHVRSYGIAAYCCHPLTMQGRGIGTLAFGTRSRTRFKADEVDMMRAVAGLVSIAMSRIHMEQGLRESEARLSSILERVPVGVGLFDTEGRFIHCNPELARLVGDAIPSRDAANQWRAFDADGRQLEPEEFPGTRALQGETPVEVDFSVTVDGEDRWIRVAAAPFVHEGRQSGAVMVAHDITDQKRREQQIGLLMREVNHRAKNILTVVQAVARQTSVSGSEDFISRFEQRLHALAANQDLLVNNEWSGVDVEELVRSQLAHFKDLVGARILLQGPTVKLSASAAQTLGIALHEMATNAGKYGALSNEIGRVEIRWQLLSNGQNNRRFAMTWVERGGPKVGAPARRGFGSTVIDGMVSASLGAAVELDFAPEGLTWRLECEDDRALDGAMEAPKTRTSPEPPVSKDGRRVLVVEDEVLVALEVAAALEEAGYVVVGPASNVGTALELIECFGCDCAVLDVNLGAETAEPIAERLARLGVPFVALSGYSREQQPALFRDAPRLSKPLQPALLIAEMQRCMAGDDESAMLSRPH